ncbi:hypothetical protein MSHOH_0803 [Methanosarcina horonobensis HB-1 = JCM 15518]|uniref:Pyridoxamine 5'-phosphate oxidase N-terminal domain-containing protein n=1 Tax=Methanosarcina horonobensis HB-1 = JCM 15518 TaxID=1434110 RepID=A0A0E3S9C6_9EURY|nr:pyridoxamine 5'-phosphate oxidase family protein [Methanosarcina horonobensis]AKB77286.1 hypothetical protein MSHOH_0803 [Methanosarcina horonobensis HB-1 = JCM 15518]
MRLHLQFSRTGRKRRGNPCKEDRARRKKLLEQLKEFFESQPFAVLATQNGTAPYASIVAFASDEKLKYILFSTTKATRKYSNLSSVPYGLFALSHNGFSENPRGKIYCYPVPARC